MKSLSRGTLSSVSLMFLGLFVAACAGGNPPTQSDASDERDVLQSETSADTQNGLCRTNAECEDDLYCNGIEQCNPSGQNPDVRGCVHVNPPSCGANQACDEASSGCVSTNCAMTRDGDGDGHFSMSCGGDDCDDNNPNRHPDRAEICDAQHIDEDCNPNTLGGITDRDTDNDSYTATRCCNIVSGGMRCGDDCDDSLSGVNPGALEVCNLRDDDCDGMTDEGVGRTFYPDNDGDGFGDPQGTTIQVCLPPARTTENNTDCDDTSPGRNPGIPEICDFIPDNDCNPATNTFDLDGDGHDRSQCGGDDCDDTNASVYPGAPELCDGLDNNCSSLGAEEEDLDHDGHIATGTQCMAGTLPRNDCDDTSDRKYPGATEICDGLDNNCNQVIDEEPAATTYCQNTLVQSNTQCVMGSCLSSNCRVGYGNCDNNSDNGCETDLRTSSEHCGGCNINCGPGGSCTAGVCDRIVQYSAGVQTTCAVRSNGAVLCWGRGANGVIGNGSQNDEPLPTLVTGISTARSVSVGTTTACALLADGTVMCWGNNSDGLLGNGRVMDSSVPTAVSNLTNVAEVSTGLLHVCARKTDGTVWCWGNNAARQLGVDTPAFSNVPLQVPGLLNITAIASGGGFTCALRADKRVLCWGVNTNAQLGEAVSPGRATPTVVAGVLNIAQIAVGASHVCARAENGSVQCWGMNQQGQVGNGSTGPAVLPTAVVGLPVSVDISAGGFVSCARTQAGQQWCWGGNDQGVFADGTTTNYPTARAIAGIINPTSIDVGGGYVCTGFASGSLYCWGANTYGQCGDGAFINRGLIGPVRTIAEITQLQTGSYHNCARRSTGAVSCWGSNQFFQCSSPTSSRTDLLVPSLVGSLTSAVGVSTGSNHSCTWNMAGDVVCWGSDSSRQIGQTVSMGEYSTPVSVSGVGPVVSVSAGVNFGCGLRDNGFPLCWGANDQGQLGIGSTSPFQLPGATAMQPGTMSIATGRLHTCAAITTGLTACWGANANGQLGIGSASARSQPALIPELRDTIQVVAGLNSSCARSETGSVQCWGGNVNGQIGDGTTAQRRNPVPVLGLSNTRQIALASSGQHVCALLNTGSVQCWGDNQFGQLGNNAMTDSLVPVAVQNVADAVAISVERDTVVRCEPTGILRVGEIISSDNLGITILLRVCSP